MMADPGLHIPPGIEKVLAAAVAVGGWVMYHARRQARIEQKVDGLCASHSSLHADVRELRQEIHNLRNARR